MMKTNFSKPDAKKTPKQKRNDLNIFNIDFETLTIFSVVLVGNILDFIQRIEMEIFTNPISLG